MKNIIIIDDEVGILNITVSLLKKSNINGIPFTNGLDAIEYVRNHEADAVIVDLAMPEINGIEVINQLRSFSEDIPIIAMSGMDWKNTILEGALIAGANKILSKPFDPSLLLTTINEILN